MFKKENQNLLCNTPSVVYFRAGQKEKKRTMLNVARCVMYSDSCYAEQAAYKVLDETPADIMDLTRELAKALTAAQHDLDTSEGLIYCDSEPAPLDVPNTWTLSHASRPAVVAALTRAHEAGIEMPK